MTTAKFKHLVALQQLNAQRLDDLHDCLARIADACIVLMNKTKRIYEWFSSWEKHTSVILLHDK